ncbi:MAG: hypothetical protein JW774_06130 [Candidatus Aureabacteria bacterium]|nr:hypothetical protein [Candidatus Auribacterota bacterium]
MPEMNHYKKDSITLKLVSLYFILFVVLCFYFYVKLGYWGDSFAGKSICLHPEKWGLCKSFLPARHRSSSCCPETSSPSICSGTSSLQESPPSSDLSDDKLISCSQ